MPLKFFITHSWKDIDFARRLFSDLTAQGLDGWLDDKTLQGGHRIVEEINRGLEWCDVYIPILSHAALESPWCWEEINAAITLYNRRGRNNRPKIVSILCESCEDVMPAVLAARLYFDFTDRYDDALRELLTRGFDISSQFHVTPEVTRKTVTSTPKVVTRDMLDFGDKTILAPPVPEFLAPQPSPAETLPRTIINPKDSKEMILIPAGEFLMGSNERHNEKPIHRVYLDAFYISRYPVTNAEYKKFVNATKHRISGGWQNGRIPSGKKNHPVDNVDWNDAEAYVEWAGGRLPTEAEWEKAASWDDSKKEKRIYPWGNGFDASKCNSSESGIGDTTPVGTYSPQGDSFYGVGDMAGNVLEWCEDWEHTYYHEESPASNPKGPTSGWYRMLRGGSSYDDEDSVRCAYRSISEPDYGPPGRGFRVVVSPV
jgi:formylglycine-generating enzyme required for sulfatase activity